MEKPSELPGLKLQRQLMKDQPTDLMDRMTTLEKAWFRKFTGRQLSDYCESHLPVCFPKTLREAATADRRRRFWQPSRHPEAIQNEAFWQQKADYIHDNPCRSGLVRAAEHWRFSSAAWYLSEGKKDVAVPQWC